MLHYFDAEHFNSPSTDWAGFGGYWQSKRIVSFNSNAIDRFIFSSKNCTDFRMKVYLIGITDLLGELLH